jgi:hypothetical protein
MPRLVKSVEKRPEEATVINWTVPVYIKNGEDYYKVCFDIKRKPLSDGTLSMTESELREFNKLFYHNTKCLKISASGVFILSNAEKNIINNYKAILWLAERFDLTSNMENNLTNGKLGGRPTIQDKWNAQADKWNQWDNLSDEEKREFKKLVNKKGEK